MQYKLLEVYPRGKFMNAFEKTTGYVCVFEEKRWYYFGKTKIKTRFYNVPNQHLINWLDSMNAQIGIWKTR